MTTLESIGYTAAASLTVATFSVISFGCAVRARVTFIAPRCTARPKDTIYNPQPSDVSQQRGNAMLGWVWWCYSIPYETLLRGVPGTGTRNGGLDGILLRVNMDGIVLLRFQALCLKVCALITGICIFIILPLNLTARCNYEEYTGAPIGCFNTTQTNLTNYDSTTLANIPDLSDGGNTVAYTLIDDQHSGVLFRLYIIVLCTWIIYFATCRISYWEWKTLLALRRVYYLEKDHWAERRNELEESLLRSRLDDEEDQRMEERDPWIPHPEQRETVVNVSLYSVLVGGLPSMPQEEIMDNDDIEAAVGLAQTKTVDWQLAFATKYFDACVPNPPGYSSSVAAVTILPSAADLANSWGKWYAAAGQLRRLRFIRSVIHEKVGYDINDVIEEDDEDENELDQFDDQSNSVRRNSLEDSGVTSLRRRREIDREIFRDCTENQEYYRSVLGFDRGTGLGVYDFGPEQTAMYSREFAQGASTCCPNGCFEGRVRRANIDELREMEKEALERVHAANLLLEKAQSRAFEVRRSIGNSLSQSHTAAIDAAEIKIEESCGFDVNTLPIANLDDESFNLFGNITAYLRKEGQLQGGSIPMNESPDWRIFEKILNERPFNSFQMSVEASNRYLRLQEAFRAKEPKVIEDQLHRLGDDVKKTVAAHLVRESAYAVVTFTSRQAAVAARQCLADGRGQNRWTTDSAVPVPPLADAAPCNICFCRGCCRPVSLSIHRRQKIVRKFIAMALLASIFIFYTIPLQAATSLLDPQSLDQVFPGYAAWLDSIAWFKGIYSGLASGLIFSFFFSLCPVMFKFIANFGSNATSHFHAEYTAMQYFWWFYVVTAIWGNSLSTIVIRGITTLSFQDEAFKVVREIANTIPTQISATWLSWIIVRSWIVLPLHFLLQVNSFLFNALGWRCCSRMVRGGGPGGQTPYRIYIDGGLVFLCAAALAPASPLLAPCALVYFLCCGPLIKRNLIFVYRPNFDAGGARWPFLFEILMSSLFVGQIIMTVMMVLKQAYGPALLAILPFFATIVFRDAMRLAFLRAYADTSLFHTSDLDGLEVNEATSPELRETFRRFLVDAHKAAYVPVCLARGLSRNHPQKTCVFTSEPACVVKHNADVIDTPRQRVDTPPYESKFSFGGAPSAQTRRPPGLQNRSMSGYLQPSPIATTTESYTQFGVTLRRVATGCLTDLESSGIQLNDDGSVTTCVFTPRASSPEGIRHKTETEDSSQKID